MKFTGKCDVCGEPISLDWNPEEDGLIDYDLKGDQVITWTRHYATAPRGANPDCAVYSSTVVADAEDLGEE